MMVYGVAAHEVRSGGFNDDVAAEIGNISAVVPFIHVIEGEGPIYGEARRPDRCDHPLLGLSIVPGTILKSSFPLHLAGGCRKNDAVSRTPSANGFRKLYLQISFLFRRAQ